MIKIKRDNISFIIPAFNCENTLTETVESIFDENFIDGDEVVIINDNSTDRTIDVIKNLINRYNKKIIYFSHSENRGGAAARNTAVMKSKNNLIFCLDSDNILKKSSIDMLYNKLKNENADVASFQSLWYFNNDVNKIIKIWNFKIGMVTLADCLSSWIVPISSGNYLYTKKSWSEVGGYVEGSGALDAWSFGLNQVAMGLKFVVLENTGYYHRIGHQSYWTRDSRKGNLSEKGAIILLKIKNLLSDDSIKYLESDFGRTNWMKELEKNRIKECSGKVGTGGDEINLELWISRILKMILKKFNELTKRI